MLWPLSPAIYLTPPPPPLLASLIHHQSLLLSHLHDSLILVRWLFFCHALTLSCLNDLASLKSQTLLYILSTAPPASSHPPFLLLLPSLGYCFLSIFTHLLFSSNLYKPVSLSRSLIVPLHFSASSPVLHHIPPCLSFCCCLIILLLFLTFLFPTTGFPFLSRFPFVCASVFKVPRS